MCSASTAIASALIRSTRLSLAKTLARHRAVLVGQGRLAQAQHAQRLLEHPFEFEPFDQLRRDLVVEVFDDEDGDAVGEVAYALQVVVDLDDRQHHAQVDGYRRQQREKILALAVDRQLVGIDHFFAAAHFERQFAVPLEQGG